ncbi:MFS transporter [Radiobacillus sp. PE A8.2]|uniref:MFS transporter n=1 Tax=Radiobacillus sp. PE A8.2 TaxID=3380349 RepID=UPI00388FEFB0
MQLASKQKVIGIALITALAIIGDSMLLIVLPLYWKEFGLTAVWQIGILLSINRFIRLPINPLVGLFYQRFNLRTGIFIAVFLAIITTLSYGIFNDFWILFIMRALWGCAWSLLRLGGYLTIIDVTTNTNRGRYVGMYNGLWGIGGLTGMLAGGILIEVTSVNFVCSLFAFVGLIALPLVHFLIPATKTSRDDKSKSHHRSWLTSSVAMVLATGMVMGFIVFGLFASTLSQLIDRSYVNEWSFFHITIGAASLAGFMQAIRWGWDPFVAPLVGRWLDSTASFLRVLLLPLFGGGMLLLFIASFQSMIIVIILLVCFQLMSTIFVTTTDTLATTAAAQSDKVKVITFHTVVVDVGAALGPLISFVLIDYFSLTIVYYVAGILLILLGIAWVIYNRSSKTMLST